MITEIWVEGDKGLGYTAYHIGYGKGNTFLEQCLDLAKHNSYFAKHFNPKNMTYWYRKIYNNEQEARQACG